MKTENNHTSCALCKVREQSIFSGMDKAAEFEKKPVKFSGKDILYREGESAEGVFCLKSGLVQMLKKDKKGQDKLISISRPGELIGASSVILSSGKYTSSAMAYKTSEACFIEKKEILSILRKNPKIAINLMKMLSGKVREMEPGVKA